MTGRAGIVPKVTAAPRPRTLGLPLTESVTSSRVVVIVLSSGRRSWFEGVVFVNDPQVTETRTSKARKKTPYRLTVETFVLLESIRSNST